MGHARGCYSRKGVDGRFHWKSFRGVGFQGLSAVKGAKVWGTAVVVTVVKASTVPGVSTVDSRALGASGSTGTAPGLLDPTGGGVSVVDCVTDGF
jgi:hypothetical protein